MRGSAQPAFTTHVTVCRWNLQKRATWSGIHAASRRDTAASTHWIFLIQNSAMTASTTLLNALLQGRLHPCGLRHGSDLQGRNRHVHTGKSCLPCARLPVLNQPHSPWRHRGILPLPHTAFVDVPRVAGRSPPHGTGRSAGPMPVHASVITPCMSEAPACPHIDKKVV